MSSKKDSLFWSVIPGSPDLLRERSSVRSHDSDFSFRDYHKTTYPSANILKRKYVSNTPYQALTVRSAETY